MKASASLKINARSSEDPEEVNEAREEDTEIKVCMTPRVRN